MYVFRLSAAYKYALGLSIFIGKTICDIIVKMEASIDLLLTMNRFHRIISVRCVELQRLDIEIEMTGMLYVYYIT